MPKVPILQIRNAKNQGIGAVRHFRETVNNSSFQIGAELMKRAPFIRTEE